LLVDLDGEVPDVLVERLDGEDPWRLSEKAMEVELGRGKATQGLEEALRGMELEEIKEFEFALPDDFPDPRVRGKTMRAKARVRAIRVIEPAELTDDLVKERFGDQGVETVDGLKERIRLEIQSSQADMDERATIDQIEGYLTRSFDFPLPEGLVRSEFANVLDRSLAALQEGGTDIEELMRPENERGQRMRKRARFQAERITRIDLIMTEIARREAIGVAHEEIANYIMMMGYRRGLRDRDLKLLLRDGQFIESTRDEILRKKVTHFLVDKATAERVPADQFRAIMEREREQREARERAFVETAADPLLDLDEDYLAPAVTPSAVEPETGSEPREEADPEESGAYR
jgi:trigger factor